MLRTYEETSIVFLTDYVLGFSFCTLYRDNNISIVYVKNTTHKKRRSLKHTCTRLLKRVSSVVNTFCAFSYYNKKPVTVIDFVEALKERVYKKYALFEINKTLFVYEAHERFFVNNITKLKIFEDFLSKIPEYDAVLKPGPR